MAGRQRKPPEEVTPDIEIMPWTRPVFVKPKLRAVANSEGGYDLLPRPGSLCSQSIIDEMWEHESEILEGATSLSQFFHMCVKIPLHYGEHGCNCHYTWPKGAKTVIVNDKLTVPDRIPVNEQPSIMCSAYLVDTTCSGTSRGEKGHRCSYTSYYCDRNRRHCCVDCGHEWPHAAPRSTLMAHEGGNRCIATMSDPKCIAGLSSHYCRLLTHHVDYHQCRNCHFEWRPLLFGQARLPSLHPGRLALPPATLPGLPILRGDHRDAGLFSGIPDPGDLAPGVNDGEKATG